MHVHKQYWLCNIEIFLQVFQTCIAVNFNFIKPSMRQQKKNQKKTEHADDDEDEGPGEKRYKTL